jgi:hypothetical protein
MDSNTKHFLYFVGGLTIALILGWFWGKICLSYGYPLAGMLGSLGIGIFMAWVTPDPRDEEDPKEP